MGFKWKKRNGDQLQDSKSTLGIKHTHCTECQLAYFPQDMDLFSPHVMQTRNSASNHRLRSVPHNSTKLIWFWETPTR